MTEVSKPSPKVGLVSLGCPKALVDSEHIVTRLFDRGYDVVGANAEDSADVETMIVNTCGFIEAARDESFATIEACLDEGKKVIVTGCLGAQDEALRQRFPTLEFISGPESYDQVMGGLQIYEPLSDASSQPPASVHTPRDRLTPGHYAYLKVSEGCNHQCSFCIIPSMRGKLRSRLLDDVMGEARQAVAEGARELLVIAQDLSAYGADLRYQRVHWSGADRQTRLLDLCEALSELNVWIRLHYVYPYPHVDKLIPLMAQGAILPYLDMPLQHASPRILQAMRRPAAAEKSLERIRRWRELCPDLNIRSTFIVGFPGETEEDVAQLLDFLEEAQLDRVGCFTYSPVDGAAANTLPGAVDERDKLDRQELVYEVQQSISRKRRSRQIGKTIRVLIDTVNADGAIGRSAADAPEIDGAVFVSARVESATGDARAGYGRGPRLKAGEFAWVDIVDADDHDLYGELSGENVRVLE